MDHAKLSASGSSTWINCPGSVQAQEGRPDTSSFFAREGTVAHELANLCLVHDKHPSEYLGQFIEPDIDDIAVDDDMVHFIQGYVEYIKSLGR